MDKPRATEDANGLEALAYRCPKVVGDLIDVIACEKAVDDILWDHLDEERRAAIPVLRG